MPEAPTVLGARTLHRVDLSKCKGHSSTDHPGLITFIQLSGQFCVVNAGELCKTGQVRGQFEAGFINLTGHHSAVT
jgi:hypothetical protein